MTPDPIDPRQIPELRAWLDDHPEAYGPDVLPILRSFAGAVAQALERVVVESIAAPPEKRP